VYTPPCCKGEFSSVPGPNGEHPRLSVLAQATELPAGLAHAAQSVRRAVVALKADSSRRSYRAGNVLIAHCAQRANTATWARGWTAAVRINACTLEANLSEGGAVLADMAVVAANRVVPTVNAAIPLTTSDARTGRASRR
jgi:hypothetical protein